MCSWSQANVTDVVTQITIDISRALPDKMRAAGWTKLFEFRPGTATRKQAGETEEPQLAREVERPVE